ncbi:MAG: hypothetical protein GY953_06820 [bacterium]|nr:hypothetical protein [bacterium]
MSAPAPTHRPAQRHRHERDLLYDVARTIGTPFIADNGRSYLWVHESSECLPIRHPALRERLQAIWLKHHGLLPRADNLCAARHALTAFARFGDQENYRIFSRIAPTGEAITVDLNDGANRVVHIRPGGWSVTTDTVGHFLRPRASGPLPVPSQPAEPGRTPGLDGLRQLLNVADRSHWLRVLTWLMSCLHPGMSSYPFQVQYPILALHGPPESGRTTAALLLRTLIDPAATPFSSASRHEAHLLRLAVSRWVLAYDDILRLSIRMTESLNRLSSGTGFELYEPGDPDRIGFHLARPQIVNLPHPIAAGLTYRTLSVPMEPIPTDPRRRLEQILIEFTSLAPRALGELCTAAAHALTLHQEVALKARCVSPDAASWALAAAPALGVTEKELSAALAVPPVPIVAAVSDFLTTRGAWTGAPADLAERLGVPARHLTRMLNRHQAELIRAGIRYTHKRIGGGQRRVTLDNTSSAPKSKDCKVKAHAA